MAKTKALDGELARNAFETTIIEDRWHVLGSAAPVGKPPAGYDYVAELTRLQLELLKLQEWVRIQGLKLVVLFERRDAAGKGGVIRRISDALNPRYCRTVALATPTEKERGRMVFPALCRRAARCRRDRAVRPQLVQPRRRRARHGLLHRRGISGISACLPAFRGDADPLRHSPRQILAFIRGYKPQVVRVPEANNTTHWYLKHQGNGHIVDGTKEQFEFKNIRIPYENGRGSGFLTKDPSHRTQELIRRIG